ncbi:hypothetical protein [Paenibacillus taiwanensis]|uniref:hypothetical protein n=1 Tax=Paenibacillus taiwanensis TaxID=401638 RepID=UPI0012FA42ED|nr:hypothetical protein [Paenibacillus taiwanensis]
MKEIIRRCKRTFGTPQTGRRKGTMIGSCWNGRYVRFKKYKTIAESIASDDIWLNRLALVDRRSVMSGKNTLLCSYRTGYPLLPPNYRQIGMKYANSVPPVR